VVRILAWPEPRPHSIAVQVDGACDWVDLRLYSVALHRVADLRAPGCGGPAWVEADLGGVELPSGAYYVVGQAHLNGRSMGQALKAKLMVLR